MGDILSDNFNPQALDALALPQNLQDRERVKRLSYFAELTWSLSDLANIGVVMEGASLWVPSLIRLGSWFPLTAWASEMAIYVLKIINRVLRIYGYYKYQIPFPEEEALSPAEQLAYDRRKVKSDLVVVSLFIATVVLLAIMNPVGIAIAWFLAFIGLAIIAKVEYGGKEKIALQKYEQAKLADPTEMTPATIQAKLAYINARNCKRFFYLLILGIGALLICAALLYIVPSGAVATALSWTSKIAGLYLVGINILRLANWVHGNKEKISLFFNSNPRPLAAISPLTQKRYSFFSNTLPENGTGINPPLCRHLAND